MRRTRIRHSLIGKVLALFILIVAIPSVAAGLTAMRLFLNILLEKSSDSYSLSVEHLNQQVDEELFQTKMSAYYVYLDLDLKQAISDFEVDRAGSLKAQRRVATKFENYRISPSFNNVNTVKIYAFNGLKMSFGDSVFSSAISDDWVLNNPLYQQAIEFPDRFIWSGIHSNTDGPGISDSISIFRVVKDRSYSSGVAMLYVNLDSKLFSSLVNGRNGLADSRIYVLDSNDNSITGTSVPKFVLDTINTAIDNSRSDYSQTIDIGGEKRLFVHYLSDYQWKIVGVLDVNQLRQSSLDLLGYFTLGFLLFLIIASIIWLAAVSYLLAPIKRLSAATKQVRRGNFAVHITPHGKDEIGQLTRDFNYMVAKVDTVLAESVAQNSREKDAQYRALQAQINPHFLYNTLNSIRWMAILQNADNIKRTIEVLARLLRNSTRKMDQFVTIDQEIENLKDYVYIEELAYSNRFKVEYNVDFKALSFQCFKFLLQPLVENAIFHGVLPKDGFGAIVVSVRKHSDTIEFEVFDNGIGMDSNASSVNHSSGHAGHKFNSIGLESVRERLQMCYLDDHCFSIDSEKGEYTRIRICIPMREHLDA
ncbi:sensor histidine kinase [Alginatibacterium sediminis]|uniref:Sensor histidine kinase n=1 Tax=Alginatibacterium sediminis TaxID=2164068 RepID=A0A420EB61_9ALTE|nr:sensor histidine kinase [Alginatibacterium sediminis]RKF17920.1 sensor histidine kinase [Alginatibacterium sediminis]